jgi:hypothetical protein
MEACRESDAVAGVVRRLVVGRHPLIHEGDRTVERRRACAERVERVERDDRRAELALRADAAAEREERQSTADRPYDAAALRAADPVRHRHRIGPDVVEAVVAHAPLGPCDRAIQRGRAADAMADRLRELA